VEHEEVRELVGGKTVVVGEVIDFSTKGIVHGGELARGALRKRRVDDRRGVAVARAVLEEPRRPVRVPHVRRKKHVDVSVVVSYEGSGTRGKILEQSERGPRATEVRAHPKADIEDIGTRVGSVRTVLEM